MPFKNAKDYKNFRTWVTEGSTIGQRMQIGEQRPVPGHWEYEAEIFRRLDPDKIPVTYNDYLDFDFFELPLPENPTDDEIEAIALATIRSVFEPTATNFRNLTIPGDGSWSAQYTAGDINFYVEYDGECFEKTVMGPSE